MTGVSARVFRRSAPAHLDRARARAEPEADRRRRAGLGARRVDPGAGHQSDDGSAAREAAVLSVHRARSRGGRAYQPPHRGHVSRQDRRVRRQATLFTNPQHPYTEALLSAVPVPNPKLKRAEAAAARRRAEPDQSAAWLHVPYELPLRRGALQGRGAETHRDQPRPRRLVPSARELVVLSLI